MDPAFSRVFLLNPDADAFEIWRIKKLKLITLPRESYGKFYDGDSYIIFCRKGGETHIHFWLGTYTSQDEATVAAYKTVELDNSLGGLPIQHREVQGYESKRFISYFKKYNGIYYLDGGFDSGLNYYERSLLPKLFCVKGKRDPMIIRQIGHICWSEMNSGDVYVLEVRSKDKNDVIFLWRGSTSNYYEKLNGAKLANILKEGNSLARVVIIDDGSESNVTTPEELEIFNSVLPLKNKASKLKDPSRVLSDEEVQRNGFREAISMYELENGKDDGIIITRVDEIKQKCLQSKKTLIIDDHSGSGIWIWVGRDSTFAYNNKALQAGQGFIKEKKYSPNISITRIVQNAEPIEFRVFFKEWTPTFHSQKAKKEQPPKTLPHVFNAKVLHEKPHLASHFRMVDDGSGKREVYRIERRELVSIPSEKHGSFYSGDCYIIFYTYEESHRTHYIIYYWLGSKSSQDERGIAALKAVELDDKYGGKPVQVRVVEGKEPPHLLSIFQGRFKILLGGVASMFDKTHEGREEAMTKMGQNILLQVHGIDRLRTRAFEVECKASSLNTNDCFILTTKGGLNYIWFGKCSIGDEREMAKIYLDGQDYESLYEGLESETFWAHLGGKMPYIQNNMSSSKYGSNNEVSQPRLFHLQGMGSVEEIFDFNQRDLIPEDVMLLDAGDSLYIWTGAQSSETEKRFINKMTEEYLTSDPTNRDLDIPIITVKQGEEPSHFRGFFGNWDFSWFEKAFL